MKHRKTSGYSKESMAKDVHSINANSVNGGWRRVEKCQQPIVMTVIEQQWVLRGVELAVVKHLSPWGMKDTMMNLLSTEICKNFHHLPKVVKDVMKSKNITYDKSKASITVSNNGPQERRDYYRIFCRICESSKEKLPSLIKKYYDALGPKPNIVSLINNFDALKIPVGLHRLCGLLSSLGC